jgi:hypothetical protein
LTLIVRFGRQKGPGRQRPGLLSDSGRWNRAPRSCYFYGIRSVIGRRTETIFVAETCFCVITLK